MPTNGNHIAKPEDFRQAAEERKAEMQAPQRVVLPKSDLAVILRRPTPLWFLFHGSLPMSLAAKQSRGEAGMSSSVAATLETAEEFIEFSKWMVDLLREVFVEPRLSLAPGANEISPEWLDEDDVNFIIRWAVGEVTTDGRDLAEFRGKRAADSPAPGAGSGDVSSVASGPAKDGPDGFSN